ncbi:MAG: acetylglutamate kinase [Nitrospirae bacterium]|nr:MAG: acetylglutamate kinase [Nitrospirota bacterium]
MQALIEKAAVLMEAFPYIRAFQGKTVVIKYGGSAMVDPRLAEGFARNVGLMRLIGMRPVVVHGGGPQIGELMRRLGKEPRFVDGIRVTDAETMDIVEMVLGGLVNKQIVALINRHGGRAVGLTGKDGRLIEGRRIQHRKNDPATNTTEIIDLGAVGEVVRVNPEVLASLDRAGFIPVIAPVGVAEDGTALNINADLVAGAVAAALSAEKLVLLTDVAGVLDKGGQLLRHIPRADLDRLRADGTLHGGFLPKVAACETALAAGVRKAHIIDGRVEHAVLLEIFTSEGVGTEIV